MNPKEVEGQALGDTHHGMSRFMAGGQAGETSIFHRPGVQTLPGGNLQELQERSLMATCVALVGGGCSV